MPTSPIIAFLAVITLVSLVSLAAQLRVTREHLKFRREVLERIVTADGILAGRGGFEQYRRKPEARIVIARTYLTSLQAWLRKR